MINSDKHIVGNEREKKRKKQREKKRRIHYQVRETCYYIDILSIQIYKLLFTLHTAIGKNKKQTIHLFQYNYS